jgi:hypothetical protein
VKLPKSFVAINLSEKVPDAFDERMGSSKSKETDNEEESLDSTQSIIPPGIIDG